jgi:hypothetical protein
VLQLLERLRLAEDLADLAIEALVPQGLDDDASAGVAVAAEEGDAEAAGAEDALRLVLVQREGSEPRRVARRRLAQCSAQARRSSAAR